MDRLSQLIAYAAEAGAQPFRPGSHDCALFAAGWVKLATGQDFARGWRSTYRSLKRGQQLLEEAGFADHVALPPRTCPRLPRLSHRSVTSPCSTTMLLASSPAR